MEKLRDEGDEDNIKFLKYLTRVYCEGKGNIFDMPRFSKWNRLFPNGIQPNRGLIFNCLLKNRGKTSEPIVIEGPYEGMFAV